MISGPYKKSVATCRRYALMGMTMALVMGACQPLMAQFGFGFGSRVGVVGGVRVDAQGAIRSASALEQQGLLRDLRAAVARPSEDLAAKTSLRMISLKKLQVAIAESKAENKPLSPDMLYLAGLQRIEYVLVYPEQNDIVLAGPAEGWVVREDASVVGENSGRPVLQLEDLLTAFRTVEAAQKAPISVSIDPSPAGELRLNRVLAQMRTGQGFNPAAVEPTLRRALGPQNVSLTTVSTKSRMAQTLLAADFHMKRLAMKLEEAPVSGLPSYMDMIKDTGAPRGTQPRWWIACDYDQILHSENMMAWRITGLGVKAMTEDQFVTSNGHRQGTGKANKQAQRWADLFTAKFDELCQHSAAFGDLRNVMDMNIVATIIRGHELEQVANCDLQLLYGTSGSVETPEWHTPKTLDPQCSFVRGRAGWTISASGGVEINPWKVVSLQRNVDDSVNAVHQKANGQSAHWWWD